MTQVRNLTFVILFFFAYHHVVILNQTYHACAPQPNPLKNNLIFFKTIRYINTFYKLRSQSFHVNTAITVVFENKNQVTSDRKTQSFLGPQKLNLVRQISNLILGNMSKTKVCIVGSGNW